MVLRCLSWIPELWIQLIHTVSQKECTDWQLPDDVVFEILTRLPPGAVVKCQKVCKEWLAITSSPYFVRMHHQNTSSILIVQISVMLHPKPGELKLLILDDDTLKFKRMRAGWISIKDRDTAPRVVGCCNTELVFMSWFQTKRYYMCNLLTRKKVIVEPPKPSVYFAIFFHPVAREYRLMFYCRARTNLEYEVFVYSCGSKTWRELSVISYEPSAFQNQVVLKGSLYWIALPALDYVDNIHRCINSIIAFNTDTEKFCAMPHPGRECQTRIDQENMYMLEMEGLLCFGNVEGDLIRIWVLVDYENWSWSLRYNVDLHWDERRFPFTPTRAHMYAFDTCMIRLWNIRRGKLMISWFYRGLFQYDLEHNIIEKLHDIPENEESRGFLVTLDLSC